MKKWIVYTLGIVLTLVVLGTVGAASYRLGFVQGASATQQVNNAGTFPRFPGFDREFHYMERDFPGQDFKAHGFDRGHSRMLPFPPFVGLLKFATLGLLLLGAYTLYKRSNWQFVRKDVVAQNSPSVPLSREKKEKRKLS